MGNYAMGKAFAYGEQLYVVDEMRNEFKKLERSIVQNTANIYISKTEIYQVLKEMKYNLTSNQKNQTNHAQKLLKIS